MSDNNGMKRIVDAIRDMSLKPYRCESDPCRGMAGPFVLSSDVVRDVIGKAECGWYWLGRELNNGVPQVNYVGRSDHDLASRILALREYEYRFFWAHITSTVHDAFNGECRDWHKFGRDMLDNKIHPDEPDGHKYICPECGIQPKERSAKG